MSKRLYVGNLDFKVNDKQLKDFFEKVGKVTSAEVVVKPMGFGFVEMDSEESAKAAIDKLNNADFNGRNIRVDFAKEKEGESAMDSEAQKPAEVLVEQPVVEEAATVKKAA
jgi:RNA recognition motif-containing protein